MEGGREEWVGGKARGKEGWEGHKRCLEGGKLREKNLEKKNLKKKTLRRGGRKGRPEEKPRRKGKKLREKKLGEGKPDSRKT